MTYVTRDFATFIDLPNLGPDSRRDLSVAVVRGVDLVEPVVAATQLRRVRADQRVAGVDDVEVGQRLRLAAGAVQRPQRVGQAIDEQVGDSLLQHDVGLRSGEGLEEPRPLELQPAEEARRGIARRGVVVGVDEGRRVAAGLIAVD